MNLIIKTENGFYQWSPNSKDELPPQDAIEVTDDHWTMKGYNRQTHYPNFETLELVAYTPEQLAANAAALIVPETYSPKEFIERFTLEELTAIYTYATTSVQMRIWLDVLVGASYVAVNDPGLLQGMAFLVYEGLITQARHDEILQ
jgi:hypothetical protein